MAENTRSHQHSVPLAMRQGFVEVIKAELLRVGQPDMKAGKIAGYQERAAVRDCGGSRERLSARVSISQARFS